MRELTPSELYRACDFGDLEFLTTAELDDLEGLLGQPRAVEAIELGIGIERDGYNIFAFGPHGTGKHSAVRQTLERHAEKRPTPSDLCYVHNFRDPHRPRLIELPPGKGRKLRRAMERVVDEIAGALRAALESDEYQRRRRRIEEAFDERQASTLTELSHEASEAGLVLVQTPAGILFAYRRGDEVLSSEEVEELSDEERQRFDRASEQLQKKLGEVLQSFSRWRREKREGIHELNREVSRFAVGPLLQEVREHFEEVPAVLAYLDEVAADIVENAERLAGKQPHEGAIVLGSIGPQEDADGSPSRRYRVNLMVDRREGQGAPVVYEDNPTYQNLVGKTEHISRLGTLVTDFTLIKPGALHRANGGYLLLDALKLLRHPYAWDGLKRALRSGQVKIEGLAEAMSLVSTYSLQPEPATLSVKIVLFGDRNLYYLLSMFDPDFGELFKVAADFAEELDWQSESVASYVRLIAKLGREKSLLPLGRAAVARIIEQGARDVGDSKKLSLYMGRVLDLMREADHCARKANRDRVEAADVQEAIEARIFRADRPRERIQEAIARGTLLVDTQGAKVGQVNGLAVYPLHDFSFGRPSRITARVRLGKGEVVDIEREVELSGPIHSKGVLILSGFLGSRFAADRPLSISASLVFEQSYSGVDGDSASAAELCALLSAIAAVPIRQHLAVTGSVNQQGEVQAIGGVNEKIEGFFDVCKARGLTGEHGVLIPASNVEHLMLRHDVVLAVTEGRFHVYAIQTIDDAIELLTGLEAGERADDGSYPKESVNARVEQRLIELARKVQEFTKSG